MMTGRFARIVVHKDCMHGKASKGAPRARVDGTWKMDCLFMEE